MTYRSGARSAAGYHDVLLCLVFLSLMMPAVVSSAVEPWRPVDRERMHFRILDGSKAIGDLWLAFSRVGDQLTVERRQTMTIKRLMIKARLDQTSTEHWVQDRFAGISSTTELTSTIKNESKSLQLSPAPDGRLAGRTGGENVSLPGDALPLSLWNGAMIHDGIYFDPGDGKIGRLNVGTGVVTETPPSGTAVGTCKGIEVNVTGGDDKQSRLFIWLDPAGRICSMRFNTSLGALDYAPVAD